jgi:hypothetical protein
MSEMRRIDFDLNSVMNKVWLKGDIGIYYCEKIFIDEDLVYLHNVYVERPVTVKYPPLFYLCVSREGGIPEYVELRKSSTPTIAQTKDEVSYGKVIPLIAVPKKDYIKSTALPDYSEVPAVLMRDLEDALDIAQKKPYPASRIVNLDSYEELLEEAKNLCDNDYADKLYSEYKKLSFFDKVGFFIKRLFDKKIKIPRKVYNNDLWEYYRRLHESEVDYTPIEERFKHLITKGVSEKLKELKE